MSPARDRPPHERPRAAAAKRGRDPRFVLYPAKTATFKPVHARIYVQDPMIASAGTHGLADVLLPGEAYLGAGPRTSRVEVVDRDFDLGRTHPPALPLRSRDGFAVGGGPPATNHKFHQVNVWATITRTLEILEEPSVLGRPIPWAFAGGRLLVHPHAHREENAYYDRDARALVFGYYEARRKTVQSCLSHDIVTHELGHAVLDGLKPLYDEIDSPDQAGFHEYFGDALAMSSALTLRDVVIAAVRARPRRLPLRNLVSDIALEFGSRGEGGRPLRSAANTRRMRDLRGNWEEHDYSEVLTGAFYDLLRALYDDAVPRQLRFFKKTRIDGQVVVAALISAARRTTRMMLRALDYCPPAGITYRDYARAVLRADEVAYPVDDRGYRRVACDVLVRRGVLRSRADGAPEMRFTNQQFRPYDVDQLSATRSAAYAFVDANRELLLIPRDVDFRMLSLYRTRKVSAERFYPPREIVIEFGWPHAVALDRSVRKLLPGVDGNLWCGGTLVFDSVGNVLHYVAKLATPQRVRRYQRYLKYAADNGLLADRFTVRPREGGVRLVRAAARRHAGRRAGR